MTEEESGWTIALSCLSTQHDFLHVPTWPDEGTCSICCLSKGRFTHLSVCTTVYCGDSLIQAGEQLHWQICRREDERSKRKLDSQNGMVLELNVCVNVFSFLFRTLYIYTVHSVNHEHTNRHFACRKDEQGQTCQIDSSFHGTCPDSLTDKDREVCTQEPGQYSGPLTDHLMAEKWAPSAEDKCKVYWNQISTCVHSNPRQK